MKELFWIDSHCHLADPKLIPDLENDFKEIVPENIRVLISSVLSRKEIIWHRESLPALAIPKELTIYMTAGIHPYYEESSKDDFDLIAELAGSQKLMAIGEIGLDNRNSDTSWQKDILLRQLDLARAYDLPVIFHVVKMYYELHKILKNNFPKVRGYLHGFNSSLEVAENFSRFDLAFSLNMCLPDISVLNHILKRGFYLMETDAPYAKPITNREDHNHLINLMSVIYELCKLTNRSRESIQLDQYYSFKQLFAESGK